MKSLVIGLGIGTLYKEVLEELRHEIITVDLYKAADYTDIDAALADHNCFNCVFICTPNYTHEELAYKVAPHSRIVFVEKPGLASAAAWKKLTDSFPQTRFLMVKNNQYRFIIDTIKNYNANLEVIDLRWINYNRIPHPGSWFTDKSKSFGGVSRDLMPHLLSLIAKLVPESYKTKSKINKEFKQIWTLSEIDSSDYGEVNSQGIYDVDDHAYIEITAGNVFCCLTADWRSLKMDDQSLQIIMDNNKQLYFDLGLCPQYVYKTMIETVIKHCDDDEFWQDQLAQDLWIHGLLE